jgi:hypothetical protein
MTVAGKDWGKFLLALYLEQAKSSFFRFIQILGKRNEQFPADGHLLT